MGKSTIQDETFKIISDKFIIQANEDIKNFKIQPQYVINMDESPYYWDYLPRKIVAQSSSERLLNGNVTITIHDQPWFWL